MRLFAPNGPLGRWLAFFLDVLLISIAWLVCCLPVFTIGAATTALHTVSNNWMRSRSDCDLKTYFRAFRDNFRQATVFWLVLLAFLAVIAFNGYLYWFSSVQLPEAAGWMVVLTAVAWLADAVYAFALQACFENPPMRTLGNALRIAASHAGTSLLLILLFGLAIFCTLLYPPGCLLYVPVCVFLSARMTWNVLSKVYNSPDVIRGDDNDGGKP